MVFRDPTFFHIHRILCILGVAISAAWASGGVVTFEVLQTTDIHTFLDSTDQLHEGGGGWLRLATLIRRERKKWGKDYVLLIDSGDTCQGTAAGTVSRGRIGSELIRALDYQVWVPGNHDLDFGVWRLYELTKSVRDRVLCANLSLQVDADRVRFAAWRMFTPAGVRVAVIGATAWRLNDWLWGRAMLGFKVESAVTALKRVMPQVIREHPDVIVLAIHEGWLYKDPRHINEIPDIVQRFPEIDLILGGHTHRPIQGMKLGQKTWYVQAGSHGAWLGTVQVSADTRKHRVVNITSKLVAAGPDIPIDPDARTVARDCMDRSRKWEETVVARIGEPITARGTPGETCATSELLCRAIADAAHVKVVLHGKLSRNGLPAGAVTGKDLFALVPYENNIVLADLTPAQLRSILEEQWQERGSSAYCGLWGLEAVFSPAGKLLTLRGPRGQALNEESRLHVAFNSYTAAGAGRRFPKLRTILRTPDARLRDTGVNTRDAVRQFLKHHRLGDLAARRWTRRERARRR